MNPSFPVAKKERELEWTSRRVVWLIVFWLIDRDPPPPINRPIEGPLVNRGQSFFWLIVCPLCSSYMSWVWDHFKRNGSKAVCTVPKASGEPCNVELEWKKSTTSLACHLTNVHGLEKGAPAHKAGVELRVNFLPFIFSSVFLPVHAKSSLQGH